VAISNRLKSLPEASENTVVNHKPCPSAVDPTSLHYQHTQQSREKHLAGMGLDHATMSSSDTLRSRLTQLLSTDTVIHECRQCGTTCTPTDSTCPVCDAPEIVTYRF
jgi:rubrerythrin